MQAHSTPRRSCGGGADAAAAAAKLASHQNRGSDEGDGGRAVANDHRPLPRSNRRYRGHTAAIVVKLPS